MVSVVALAREGGDVRDMFVPVVAGGILLLLLGLSVSCQKQVWDECRAAGHSKFYCWKMIQR